MSDYFCIRCGYSTRHKGTFLRHLERVKPCKPKLGKFNKGTIYRHNKLTIPGQPKDKKSTKKSAGEFKKEKKDDHGSRLTGRLAADQVSQTADFTNQMFNQLLENDISDEEITVKIHKITQNQNSGLSCKFCGKMFQHKQSKYRHEKSRCKFVNKGNIKIIKEQEEELQEKNILIEELLKQNNLLKQNKFINNENENSILSYTKTNKKFLTDEMISKCMEKQNMCVPEMIKLVHFNNIHPENKNIYISNLKTNYVMVYDGDKWIVKNRDQMLDKLISDNEKFMHKKLSEWYDETNNVKYKKAMKKFQKYLHVNANTNLIDNIKDELKLMFYNNRGKNTNVLNNYIVTEIK
jgi:hypothetical protein